MNKLQWLAFLAAGLSLHGKARAECVGVPYDCVIGVGIDHNLGQDKNFAHFCTLEFTVTSVRSVPDPFNTTAIRGGDQGVIAGVEIANIWPGRYEGNDQTTCGLPIELGSREFQIFPGSPDLRPDSRWLGRAVTEQQVSNALAEDDKQRGHCRCSDCPCPTEPGVPRSDVLWLVAVIEFPFDFGDEFVQRSMDEGKCPVETPPCNCDECSATGLGSDNGGSLMALFAFSTLARRMGGWWTRRRPLRAQDAS